jgi:hypothetical protein
VSRLRVDDEGEPVELLDRKVPGIRAQEHALDPIGGQPASDVVVHTVAGQTALDHALLILEHRREPLRHRGLDDQRHLTRHHRIRHVEVGVRFPGPERAQDRPQLLDRGDAVLDQLHLKLASGIARELHGLLGGGILRVVERHHPPEAGNHLPQERETLPREVRGPAVHPGDSPAGLPEIANEPDRDRIGPGVEDDRDLLGGAHDGEADGGRPRVDQVDVLRLEVPRRRLYGLQIALGVADVEDQPLPILESKLAQTVPEPVDAGVVRRSPGDDDADLIDAGRLRLDRGPARARAREDGQRAGDERSPGQHRRAPALVSRHRGNAPRCLDRRDLAA